MQILPSEIHKLMSEEIGEKYKYVLRSENGICTKQLWHKWKKEEGEINLSASDFLVWSFIKEHTYMGKHWHKMDFDYHIVIFVWNWYTMGDSFLIVHFSTTNLTMIFTVYIKIKCSIT
jgi:hypothetical protein